MNKEESQKVQTDKYDALVDLLQESIQIYGIIL
jgi:hypothetical protein